MKKLALLLTILSLVLMMVSCNSNSDIEQDGSSLTIAFPIGNKHIDRAISKYENLYPDVELNIITEESIKMEEIESFYKTLSTEIMAGNGPDVIIGDRYFDVNKIIYNGVFADMSNFFDNDSDFNKDEYNMDVLNAGNIDGEQLVIPLTYSVPILLSTDGMLEKTGFNPENCGDFFSFWSELESLDNRIKNNPELPQMLIRTPVTLKYFMSMSGINWIDYKNKSFNLDNPEVKQSYDYFKKLLSLDYGDQLINPRGEDAYWCASSLKKEISVLEISMRSSPDLLMEAMAINSFDNAAIFPIRDINGTVQAEVQEFVAVNNSSKNLQNAYNFIKLLIDPEIVSTGSQEFFEHIPISNLAFKKMMKEEYTERAPIQAGNETTDNFDEIFPITDEFINEYMSILDDVSGAYFISPMQREIRFIMEQYYADEKTYEECMETLNNTLKIYMTE